MKLIVEGPQQVNGEVSVSGAKNSATRVLAASLLTDEKVSLRNFPSMLEDVKEKVKFIERMGAIIDNDSATSSITVQAESISFEHVECFNLPIRTTYLLAAGSLVREGYAYIPYPGGCKIGSRGYDLHMMVWRQLGCEVEEKENYIEVKGKLVGGVVDFNLSTVGGTENALLCGVVADGETLIRNAYVTPEVIDLIKFLREMGAKIELEGSSHIRIKGAGGLLHGASFSIMPDRIEALTWIVLAAATNGRLLIHNVPFDSMAVPLIHLKEAGIDLFSNSNTVMVSPGCLGAFGIQPFELACGTHPGVISDMQSFYTFLALFANGRSVIYDYRYPERIAYAEQLKSFAPEALDVTQGKIVVRGGHSLKGNRAHSTDLRGSMALIMAAICAEGVSEVTDVELALRGYNNLPEKLANMGIKCQWNK